MSLVSDEQRTKAVRWVHEFMAAGDRLDPRPWVELYFSTDAEFVRPERDPIKGHENIIAFMIAHQGVLERVKHVIGRIDVLPDRIYEEAAVEWVVKGDPEARVIRGRGMGVLDKKIDEDRISRFDVYGDFSDLAHRVGELHGKGHE